MVEENEIWTARRAAAGGASEQRWVLSHTGPVMLRVIRRVLGSRADETEDVLQEASVDLLAALEAFRGECTLRHYAGRIAARHAIRARRKREREAQKVIALRQSKDLSTTSGPEGRWADRFADEQLFRDVLSRIPAEQAEALVLRVVVGFTLPEVSNATGVPLNTVRSRIRLARQRLRGMLIRQGVRR
ncbi:MAG TPA: sigma-70 family RNA polymerase sigma factor [Polyangiaceae bacterium]|nr:sigma-70 family RNA polymerase sigma factor [Polyangiaceae bacterium]